MSIKFLLKIHLVTESNRMKPKEKIVFFIDKLLTRLYLYLLHVSYPHPGCYISGVTNKTSSSLDLHSYDY